MSNTNIRNIDSATFGNTILETDGTYGFDGNAPDKHKRDIQFRFHLSDEAKKLLLERLAAALRIKANQKDEPRLKGNPRVTNYEEYAELVDSMDGTLEITAEEMVDWLTPSKRTAKSMTQEDWVWYQYKEGEINEQQRDQMLSIIEDSE